MPVSNFSTSVRPHDRGKSFAGRYRVPPVALFSSAQSGLGEVFLRLGNLSDANGAYTRALELAERRLLGADTANTEWQRDLSVSHDKIGDVLVAQGDRAGALAAYRQSLAIAEALAARDTANTECAPRHGRRRRTYLMRVL